MKIEYKDIILRDMTEADIEDDIRWNTVETDWSNWDAPWEPLPDISDTDSYRKKELLKLAEPKDKIRWGFEICKRKIDYREVNGKKYDGLSFRLSKEKFYNYLNG